MNLPVSYASVPVSWHFLIETLSDDRVSAWVAQLPECRVVADSRDSAIDALNEALELRLEQIEVLAKPDRASQVSIHEAENPWMKHAGIFKDDPLFEELLEDIAIQRKELDASREEMRDLV